ncbi:unnamed protein product [Ectocarpus sp. 13 AM-2016]
MNSTSTHEVEVPLHCLLFSVPSAACTLYVCTYIPLTAPTHTADTPGKIRIRRLGGFVLS